MRNTEVVKQKIYTLPTLLCKLEQLRLTGTTVSFTNGCFDILHKGHIASLSQAAAEASVLIVGVNSDASTKKLKGEGRPVNDQESRALLLASLLIVDAVVIFDEETPLELIKAIKPDVLVKGATIRSIRLWAPKKCRPTAVRWSSIPLWKVTPPPA